MILTAIHGFCMALADSVPGVSGGTIAFILGFYDRFLDALHSLFGRDAGLRKAAVLYLLKLGLGWAVGMGACVLALSKLFAAHIYFMSSLFLPRLCRKLLRRVILCRKNLHRKIQHWRTQRN